MGEKHGVDWIEHALNHQQLESVLDHLKTFRSADLADLIAQLSLDQAQLLLMHLPKRANVFSHLSPHHQVLLAEEMSRQDLAEIIGEMSSDKRVDVFKRLDIQQQNALLPALAQAEREDIRLLSSYQEGTAGAVMSSEYATLLPNLNVVDAITMLRQEAPDTEMIYVAYVLNEVRQLLGVITLKELILAQPEQNINELMTTDLLYADVDTNQDEVAKTIAKYDLLALPVVDKQGTMVGIVTYDDAMDVAKDEATEDFLKSGAVNASSAVSLKTTPVLKLYQKRIFWLVFLVFGSVLSGISIAHFEDTLAKNMVLVFFLPLLVGSGGNAGSQSATLMVRALATGDVEFKDWFYLMGREILVALCLGLTMAFAVSILGFLRGGEMVALVLILSMIGIVLLGCLIGMSLPFILNRLGFDPASASAPLVTSICDAMGVLIYLFIASVVLF